MFQYPHAPPTLQVALKCSDLGHLTSSVEVHKQWVTRLEEVSLSCAELPL